VDTVVDDAQRDKAIGLALTFPIPSWRLPILLCFIELDEAKTLGDLRAWRTRWFGRGQRRRHRKETPEWIPPASLE